MRKIAVVFSIGVCLAVCLAAGFPRLGDAATPCNSGVRDGVLQIECGSGERVAERLFVPPGLDEIPPGLNEPPPGWTVTPQGVVAEEVHGIVDENGIIVSGEGFTVSHFPITTGHYIVHFDPPFADAPACVVSPVMPQPSILRFCAVAYNPPSSTGVDVLCYTLSAAAGSPVAPTDTEFNFICSDTSK